VVVTGCAHPGILAILRRAREVTPGEIALVLGGFHLVRTPEPELGTIVRAFRREFGVKRVAATHCTGDEAIAAFRDAYGADFIPVGAGKALSLAGRPR
jgi:7,8-dihydropterin-6-yl-methyl-4-(beta-D-ribofuranosyl)aminobenzene 5'-phosphate synthase